MKLPTTGKRAILRVATTGSGQQADIAPVGDIAGVAAATREGEQPPYFDVLRSISLQ